jgi:hypothetical protein
MVTTLRFAEDAEDADDAGDGHDTSFTAPIPITVPFFTQYILGIFGKGFIPL